MNKIISILIIVVIVLASPFYYHYSPLHASITKAVAVVHPTQGNQVNGIVTFTQEKNGVRVQATLHNLTPGKHGIHIHEMGDCGCPDAQCAGDHFNPTGQPHGGPESAQRHVGDFGNITADQDGNATVEFLDTHVSLNGRHSIIGRSVIIHEKEDDLVSQPSGDAGARIGCGVIGIGKSAK